MPATSSVSASGLPDVDGLLSGVRWQSGALSYSFPTSGSFYGTSYSADNEPATFGVLSATQQGAIRTTLGMFGAVSGLTFTELTETDTVHATLRYALSDAPATAWAYYPSNDAAGAGGDVWIRKSGTNYSNPVAGTYAWATFLHETGHALGLKHGHEAGGGFPALPANRDSLEYSVMTYRSYVGDDLSAGGYTNQQASYPQTLMMDDIAALQYMYGPNFGTNGGDTVYTWSPSTGQAFVNGVGQSLPAGNRILMTVWDGGGIDTYDFSNYTANLRVDLRPGSWSTASAAQLADLGYYSASGPGSRMAAGNVANALLYNGDIRSLIENAVGGPGNDAIVGNDAANMLSGGAGNDNLFGGSGNDVLYGGTGDDAFFVSETADQARENPGEGNDTAFASVNGYTLDANVESLVLTGSAYSGSGNAASNLLYASDALASALTGGAGNDYYYLKHGSDQAIELPGGGFDIAFALVNGYTLDSNLESLVLMDAAWQGAGNAAANLLYANSALASVLAGGGGDDSYFLKHSSDRVTELAGEGYDTVFATVSGCTLDANVESLALTDSAAQGFGNGQANLCYANDALASTIVGAGGDDGYILKHSNDRAVEDVGGGYDTVFALANGYALDPNVEALVLIEGATQAFGNDDGNLLYANGGLASSLAGRGGNDSYHLRRSTDQVVEVQGGGSDTAFTAANGYLLDPNVESLVLVEGATNGWGNDEANLLYANDALASVLTGGQGNDAYFLKHSGDQAVEMASGGTDVVFAYFDGYVLHDNVENLILSGGALTGFGNGGANSLEGNALNNVLDGRAGADFLTGGLGNDIFVFRRGEASGDLVQDFDGQAGGVGDSLRFEGFGTAAQGASFVQLDATHWQINSADGLAREIITFVNGANVHPSDFAFV